MISNKKAPFGYKKDGTPRQRAPKELELPIFNRLASSVSESDPQHVIWQRITEQRCAEIQAGWTPEEEKKRRGGALDFVFGPTP